MTPTVFRPTHLRTVSIQTSPLQPYAGVGSLEIRTAAVPISAPPRRLIRTLLSRLVIVWTSAADGVPDISGVDFHLNYNGDLSHTIAGVDWWAHPDYTGFANPSVNDDVSIIKLASPLPAGIPIYQLNTDPSITGEQIQMVGYGQSGNGATGSTTGASYTVKRKGENIADSVGLDDDGGNAAEVWEADFDGPTASTNYSGGLTLGNDIEASIGGGDSGGPSFIPDGNGGLKIFGINTYSFRFNFFSPTWPYFGSGLGGMAIAPYVNWIDSIVGAPGVTITQSGGSTDVNEVEDPQSADTDSYELVLDEPPTSDVTITSVSDNGKF